MIFIREECVRSVNHTWFVYNDKDNDDVGGVIGNDNDGDNDYGKNAL